MSEIISDKDVESLSHTMSNSFSRNFMACSRLLSRFYSRNIESSGLSYHQFDLMMMLLSNKGKQIDNTEISDIMGMDRTTMTRNLEHMSKKGFIVRKKSTYDKRAWGEVTVTNLGLNHLRTALPQWKETDKIIRSIINMGDRAKELFLFKQKMEEGMPGGKTKH